ncbi:MAG: DNA-processing protein DprA [Bacteroidales bacterium]|jgi:DNA processing protein
MTDLQLKIALSIIPNVGPRLVRRLVAYAGSVEAVFHERKRALEKIPGIGEGKASFVQSGSRLLETAAREIEYVNKEGIVPMFYLDKNYPLRLKECEDAPVILYVKGNVDFNAQKVISIVGTRKASEYGRICTEEIVEYLAAGYPELVIVSGLAYGIDIAAHKAAMKNHLSTIAALAHGFDFLYPSLHARHAEKILEQGALVTEFRGERKPDPGNFVSRNRIIAGLADATVIIESAVKGGALITAELANSYNRDVFAVPGKSTDTYSKGCNNLIKYNRAALIENGRDLEYAMGWYREKEKPQVTQKSLFTDLSPDEEKIMSFLSERENSSLDEICISLGMPVAKVSSSLINLEFNGLVRPQPGKYYAKT